MMYKLAIICPNCLKDTGRWIVVPVKQIAIRDHSRVNITESGDKTRQLLAAFEKTAIEQHINNKQCFK